jgi:hypothetical protein
VQKIPGILASIAEEARAGEAGVVERPERTFYLLTISWA